MLIGRTRSTASTDAGLTHMGAVGAALKLGVVAMGFTAALLPFRTAIIAAGRARGDFDAFKALPTHALLILACVASER